MKAGRILHEKTQRFLRGRRRRTERVYVNPAMHKASDAGHIEPQPCGIALALAIGGGAMCRRPAPGGTKTALF